jgi:C4-dicarboxylate-specific signal transduction histidine kinase
VLAVAHEINQPLSAVVNYASGCQKRLQRKYGNTLPNEIQEGLRKCVEQARRAGNIVHTLKDMLCYKNYHPELTSVNRLINSSITILAEEIDATKAKLELILANNLQRIKCDRIQLELVLTNLIKNACEAIVEQGENNNVEKSIIISTDETETNAIKIIVENTGCTIRSEVLNKVFFPFSGTKDYGLGLGLALTKNIVEQHKGDIRVYLTEIPSVRFEIILPAVKS